MKKCSSQTFCISLLLFQATLDVQQYINTTGTWFSTTQLIKQSINPDHRFV